MWQINNNNNNHRINIKHTLLNSILSPPHLLRSRDRAPRRHPSIWLVQRCRLRRTCISIRLRTRASAFPLLGNSLKSRLSSKYIATFNSVSHEILRTSSGLGNAMFDTHSFVFWKAYSFI